MWSYGLRSSVQLSMHTTIQVHHTTSKEQAKNKRLKKFLMAIGENGANLKALMDDMDLRKVSKYMWNHQTFPQLFSSQHKKGTSPKTLCLISWCRFFLFQQRQNHLNRYLQLRDCHLRFILVRKFPQYLQNDVNTFRLAQRQSTFNFLMDIRTFQ